MSRLFTVTHSATQDLWGALDSIADQVRENDVVVLASFSGFDASMLWPGASGRARTWSTTLRIDIDVTRRYPDALAYFDAALKHGCKLMLQLDTRDVGLRRVFGEFDARVQRVDLMTRSDLTDGPWQIVAWITSDHGLYLACPNVADIDASCALELQRTLTRRIDDSLAPHTSVLVLARRLESLLTWHDSWLMERGTAIVQVDGVRKRITSDGPIAVFRDEGLWSKRDDMLANLRVAAGGSDAVLYEATAGPDLVFIFDHIDGAINTTSNLRLSERDVYLEFVAVVVVLSTRLPPYALLEVLDWLPLSHLLSRKRKVDALHRVAHRVRCMEARRESIAARTRRRRIAETPKQRCVDEIKR